MDKNNLIESYAFLKLSTGVFKKMVNLFDEEDLDFKPVEPVRTVREIILHVYGQADSTISAIENGGMTQEEAEKFDKINITSKAEIIKFMDDSFKKLFNFVMNLTEEDLNKNLKLFYGNFSVGQVCNFFFIEHIHHYAQLTVYARLLGIEPPFTYGFEEE